VTFWLIYWLIVLPVRAAIWVVTWVLCLIYILSRRLITRGGGPSGTTVNPDLQRRYDSGNTN
jgi:hypothetical protein